MERGADRVERGAAPGRSGRGLDLALGMGAMLPLLGCVGLAWLAPGMPALIVRTLAVIWSACLLAFFAGVRRGLSFSETAGAGAGELATMLIFFGFAVVSMLVCSPLMAALGLSVVGVLDAVAARRGETPRYFTLFRPMQMAVCAAALVLVEVHTG